MLFFRFYKRINFILQQTVIQMESETVNTTIKILISLFFINRIPNKELSIQHSNASWDFFTKFVSIVRVGYSLNLSITKYSVFHCTYWMNDTQNMIFFIFSSHRIRTIILSWIINRFTIIWLFNKNRLSNVFVMLSRWINGIVMWFISTSVQEYVFNAIRKLICIFVMRWKFLANDLTIEPQWIPNIFYVITLLLVLEKFTNYHLVFYGLNFITSLRANDEINLLNISIKNFFVILKRFSSIETKNMWYFGNE